MKRKLRKRQWNGLLPTSGELLGGLARLFDWKPKQSAQERTWRKFCGGGRIHEETRRAIVEEMAGSLVRRWGPGQNVEGVPLSEEEATRGLGELVMVHITWWDGLRGRLQAALPTEPTAFTTAAVLRLAVVEMALRLSGLFVLKGIPLELPPVLPGQKGDIGRLLLPWVLREVLKEASITRMALAEALGVSKEAVDQWLKPGALIRPALLDDIAEVVTGKLGGDPVHLGLGLRVMRQMTRVFMPLADVVGNEELGQLFVALVRLTAVARATLAEHVGRLEGKERAMALGVLVLAGAESPMASLLREAMLEQPPDESWKGAISTPPGAWGDFMSRVFASEMVLSRMTGFLEAHGFPSLEQHTQRLHQMVLLPREELPAPLLSLASLSPSESRWACALSLARRFQWLRKQKLDPDVLPEFGLLAECCGILAGFLEGELRDEVEDIRWRCLSIFILGCMSEGQELLEQGRHPEAIRWAQRIEKAVRTLPPFPTNAAPKVRPVLDFLRLMIRMQEEVDAGRIPKPGPQDLAFLAEMKRQQAEGGLSRDT